MSNVKDHYKLPSAMRSTKAQAKDEPNVMKYNAENLRYETKVTVPTSYVTASSLAHNFSSLESKLGSLIKSKFSGTFGKDYGLETEMSGTNTPYGQRKGSSLQAATAVYMLRKVSRCR